MANAIHNGHAAVRVLRSEVIAQEPEHEIVKSVQVMKYILAYVAELENLITTAPANHDSWCFEQRRIRPDCVCSYEKWIDKRNKTMKGP